MKQTSLTARPKAMDAAPSLKEISKHGSGTDTIDKPAAQTRGIEVAAAAGANAAAVAEHAMALLLGAIGRRFARMADAMEMRVIGDDPFANDLPGYVQLVDLETIWREADAISLHCPLTAENRGLLNAKTLAACRRGMIVVNTARGGLVDEAALLAAVRSGQVASAGVDNYAAEPVGDTGKVRFQGAARRGLVRVHWLSSC